MTPAQIFAARLYWMCAEADGGYSQPNRLDVARTRGITDGYFTFECDCSSLVLEAARQAGYSTGLASYTGDMRPQLEAVGWTVIPIGGGFDPAALYTGDVLLSERDSGGVGHTAAYIGDDRLAEAWIDGLGDIGGSAWGDGPGDDTGAETRVVNVWDHPYTVAGRWTHILRPPAAATSATPATPTHTSKKGNPRMSTRTEGMRSERPEARRNHTPTYRLVYSRPPPLGVSNLRRRDRDPDRLRRDRLQ